MSSAESKVFVNTLCPFPFDLLCADDLMISHAVSLCRTVNVTVAKEVKSVVVATDKNAPADQILEFLVCHKEDVGMVELEVRDLRLGAFQVFANVQSVTLACGGTAVLPH